MIIHVPADWPTIQAAIDAALDGDTVLVANGRYTENINFKGKAITVTSAGGPQTTIIDGGAVDSVVSFRSGETSASVLNGFTITNGASSENGGGVYVLGGSPTITNNVITTNQACNGGGGIGIDFASPRVQGNTISNNVQSSFCGGGIGGGGVSIGGAESGGTQLIGNIISNNTNLSGGGGLTLFAAGGPLIQDNIFSGNNGGSFGGAIVMFNDAQPQIVGNLFIHNTAAQGGALYWLIPRSISGMLLLNNTMADNSSTQGSAIFSAGFIDTSSLQNNLIIGQAGREAIFCDIQSGPPPEFTANDVFTAGAASYGGICADQTGTNGNISADPLFVDPSVDNFHLLPLSPAAEAGNNIARIALPATDLDGNPRVFSSTVDIGALEYQGTTTATLSAASLVYAVQPVGTTSAAQVMTITNTGSATLQIAPFAITGDFNQTSDCHTSAGIGPGKSCSISISFSPTAGGVRTGAITITSNDAAGPAVVHLSGTGRFAAVRLSVADLQFPHQRVGTTSEPQSFTLTNIGDVPLIIVNIAVNGDFEQNNNCGTTVGIGGSCTFHVSFAPTVRGTRDGSIGITDNATGSPESVTLEGTAHGHSPK